MAGVGEVLVSAVLKEVVGRLGSAAVEEIKMRWNLGRDMADIKSTLGMLQSVLGDAERRSIRDEGVNLWLKALKSVAYDISDLLDEFQDTLSQQKFSTTVTKFFLGRKLKSVRAKLTKIAAQQTCFGFTIYTYSDDLQEISKRETTSKINQATIVGRKQDKEEIVRMLESHDDKKTSVIPIFGFGGLGKTTLAKLVFNDDRMQSFDLRIWVYVSPNFDLKMIGKCMISQIKGQSENLDDLQSVSNCLEETLEGKSCLIVLDDLWENNCFQLGELMLMLSSFKKKSMIKVIVTTRTEEVARNIGTVLPYKLKPLSDDHCWTLFKQIAFQPGYTLEEGGDKDVLENIGREISKKCKGVPLAAQALGFMLRTKDVEEWKSVRDSDIWNGTSSTDDVLPSLKLSYHQMPSYLKLCFSYCSVFPKGYEMHRDNLIQQWISLGFVHSSPGKHLTLEKIGKNYVNELLGMSFLQYSRQTSLITKEDVKSCMLLSMHDLMHDLARSIIGDELIVLDGKKNYISGNDNCRYALVHNCASQKLFCNGMPAKLRALHFVDCSEIQLPSFSESLRVLDLGKCSSRKFPEAVGKYIQLRYFSAHDMQHGEILKRVTSLSKLIYLNINGISQISTLPESVKKLKSLLHLDLSGCSNLRTLPESFGDLTNLSHLNLANCSLLSNLPQSINKLESLLHLYLSGCSNLHSLPESFGDLTNLSHLNLSNCYDLDGLPKSFGSLSELQNLNLSSCYKLNLRVDIATICCLTKLQILNLSRCPNLIHIPESVRNLKDLHTLDLSGCQWIERFPQSICQMISLKFLLIERCSPWLQKRVEDTQFKNGMLTLPRFIVQRAVFGTSSNISQLQSVNPAVLEIECLENVMSVGEVEIVNLADKSALSKLVLAWTPDVEHLVEDEALLQNLQPPETLMSLQIQGYMAHSFSGWMMDLSSCLPHLVYIEMVDLPSCEYLPPFGQLQNLKRLALKRMPNLKKVGMEICGANGAFKELREFTLVKLDSLNEWITKVSASGEFVFPSLHKLEICHCPKLRFKPCLPRAVECRIEASSEVLAGGYHACLPSCMQLSKLHVRSCQLTPNEWTLLQFLPDLEVLEISNYTQGILPSGIGYLTSLRSLQIDGCNDLVELPQWLSKLSSLNELIITDCISLVVLPELLQKLVALEKLEINDNNELQTWCKKRDCWIWGNDMKNKIYFDGKLMIKNHPPKDECPPGIGDGNHVQEDRNKWGEDEYLKYFGMFKYGESSRTGR